MRNRGAAAHPECIGAGVGLGSWPIKLALRAVLRFGWEGCGCGRSVGVVGPVKGPRSWSGESRKSLKVGGETLGRRCSGWGLPPNASRCWCSPVWFFSSVLFTDSPGVIRLRFLILSPGDFSCQLSYSWKTLSIGFLFSTGRSFKNLSW